MDLSRHGSKADVPNESPTPPQWENFKPQIKDFYIVQNLVLSETMRRMELLGFSAT